MKSASSCHIPGNFAAILLTIVSIPCFLFADEPRRKTGKALENALSAEVRWASVRAPLGEQLRDLQEQAEVAILRDRRIDPQRPLYLDVATVSRVQILRSIANSVPDGAFCLTENFAWIGPAQATYRLPMLLRQNSLRINGLQKEIDAEAFRRMTRKRDASWHNLDEPRQILLDHAKAAGVRIKNADLVPHDVWGQVNLPPMTFSDCATLLLNQFDLTFSISPETADLTLVPVDMTQIMEFRYDVGSSLKSKVATAWQDSKNETNLRWNGSHAIVIATLAEHVRLNSVLTELKYTGTSGASALKTSASLRTTQFQLKVERATIGQLIEYFRTNGIVVDVKNENEEQTKLILSEIVQLNNVGEKMPGTDFFPLVFGRHFPQVNVQDDRVILSPR